MEARFDGRDYTLHLSPEECLNLPEEKLVCSLLDWSGNDLGRQVELSYGWARNHEGVDLTFETSDPSSDVNVVINDWGHETLVPTEEVVTTYGGTDHKVRIVKVPGS